MNFKEIGLIAIIASVFGAAHASSIVTSKAYVDMELEKKQDAIPGYDSSNDEVQSILTDTENDGEVGKRAILDMQTYSVELSYDMLVDDQYKDMIPDVGLIGTVLDEAYDSIYYDIDDIRDNMPQAMVWNNILDTRAVKRYSTSFNDGLNWPSSQENQFVTGNSLAQGLALKQNRQIGAEPVDSNSVSTDVGKVLVVGNDGKIAMGSAPDSAPTDSSNNLVTSGGVYSALQSAVSSIHGLPSGSANQVLQYNGTTSAWESTTMDTTPTQSSVKPVTSGGVKTYVDSAVATKQDKIPANSFTAQGMALPGLVGTTDSAGVVDEIGIATIKAAVANNDSSSYAALASEITGGDIEALELVDSMVPSYGFMMYQLEGIQDGVSSRINQKQDKLGGSGNGGKVVMATDTAGVVDYKAIDSEPTNSSPNLVTSGGVYSALQSAIGSIDGLPSGSANQVLQYNGTTSAWESTTMDTTPTQSSVKPVTSGGVYTALSGKQNVIPANNFEIQGMSIPGLVATTDSAGTVGEVGMATVMAVSAENDSTTFAAIASNLDIPVADLTILDSVVPSYALVQMGMHNMHEEINGKQAKKTCVGWPDGTTTADSTHTDSNCWLWNLPD